MTLSTHSVVGASIAALSQVNPAAAFLLGFGSHFLLDAIPHWDYRVTPRNVITDIGIGLALVLSFFLSFPVSFPSVLLNPVLWGAFGAVVPDLLIGLHIKYPTKFIGVLHYFHIEIMHSKIRLDDKIYLGPLMQLCVIVSVLGLVQYYAQM